jgi:DNA-binding NarL/FixJ family response regulator
MVKVVARLEAAVVRPAGDATARKRQMVAELCRLLGEQVNGGAQSAVQRKSIASVIAELRLSPRVQQTLERLLVGDSEKQVANQMGVSPHTVHCHVKALYRRLNVSSRGELLAHFIATPNLPNLPNEPTR